MANPVAAPTRSPGESAALEFQTFVTSEINDEPFMQDGQRITFAESESVALQARYKGLLEGLNGVVERSIFQNRVSQILGSQMLGTDKERTRMGVMTNRIAGAFQTTVGGVNLQQQAAAPVPTGIDFSGVNDAATATEVFTALLRAHAQDETGFTIKAEVGTADAPFNGQRVRFGGNEVNRLRSVISELMARLPREEAMIFHNNAVGIVRAVPVNDYETQRTIPRLLNQLSTELQKK